MTTLPAERLLRRRVPAVAPVTSRSLLLFRLGELCNNRCPMCSNSGDPALWQIAREELLARVERVVGAGFRRVILTGGEPTIHPAFWEVVEAFRGAGVRWDLNSHGRSFHDPAFAARAMARGLDRAIVSFHSHLPATAALISGSSEAAAAQTLAGIDQLAARGARLLLNLVLCHANLDHVGDWVRFCAERWGGAVGLKVCFPWHGGRGGGWEGIALRLDDVRPAVAAIRAAAARHGARVCWESLPLCVHGDPQAADVSRSGFGESHYLDDADGRTLYSIRAIEASLHAYGERCQGCAARPRCPGVEEAYLRAFGADELGWPSALEP
jgi:pyruvate-formate lyase-activating enzyme